MQNVKFKHIVNLSMTMTRDPGKHDGWGVVKSRIILEILKGNNTRNKLKIALGNDISRKDLNYHLATANNGLVYEGVLTERKGVISINTRSIESLSNALKYLINVPEFEKVFNETFADCLISGFDDSNRLYYHPMIKIADKSINADNWIMTGIRNPKIEDKLARSAVERFENHRGTTKMDAKLAYLAVVLYNYNRAKSTDSKGLIFSEINVGHFAGDHILELAKENFDYVKLAFFRVFDIFAGKEERFLDEVSETEKMCKEIVFNATAPFGMDIEAGYKLTLSSHIIKKFGLIDYFFNSSRTYSINPDGIPILSKRSGDDYVFLNLLHDGPGYRFIQIAETGEIKALLGKVDRHKTYYYSPKPEYEGLVIPERYIAEIIGTNDLTRIMKKNKLQNRRKTKLSKKDV